MPFHMLRVEQARFVLDGRDVAIKFEPVGAEAVEHLQRAARPIPIGSGPPISTHDGMTPRKHCGTPYVLSEA